MDNPYYTSDIIAEIKHMRRRHRIRMWLTQGILILTIWLIMQVFNVIPNLQLPFLNQVEDITNQNIEGVQHSQFNKTDADMDKINKLSDIADV